jgi:serine/threonine protein kinase
MLINDHLRWQAKQEIEIHCSLDHPNIVKAYEYSQDDNEYILLMEYLPKADYLKEKII